MGYTSAMRYKMRAFIGYGSTLRLAQSGRACGNSVLLLLLLPLPLSLGDARY